MKKITSFIVLIISSLCASATVQSQSLVEFAKKQEQRSGQLRQEEEQRYKAACRDNTIPAYKTFIRLYPNSRFSADVRKRILDYNLWEKAKNVNTDEAYQQYLKNSSLKCFESEAKTAMAKLEIERQREVDRYAQVCQANTLSQYNEFLATYPKSRFKEDIQKRIKDSDLWQKARNKNTIGGYELYLATSKYKCFEKEAKKGIEEINASKEWKFVCNSMDIAALEKFMKKYVSTSFYAVASRRVHELIGWEYYKNNEYSLACTEFEKAGGRDFLSLESRLIYDICKEHQDFIQLDDYSPASELEKYIAKYPSGKYTNEVSNRLAIIKSSEFTAFSTENYMYSVLRLAKDEPTRKIVRKRIKKSKKELKKYIREENNKYAW